MSIYLSRVDIPNSVTHIGDYAFSSSSIKKIDIPQSVESIGEDAFGGTEIKRIKLPEGLDSIKKRTFSSCSQLKRMVVPKSVVSIGKYAFRDCKKLKSISIPQSVNSIEYGAFWGCLKLKKIKISPKNQHFFSRRGGLYTKSGDTLVAFPSMNRRNRNNLKTVKHIGEGAFAKCGYLGSFVIPKGVETIGDGAFQRCEFDELVIPNTVTSIGNYAFAGSYFEDTLKIPNSVKSLGDYVFADCNGEVITDIEMIYNHPAKYKTSAEEGKRPKLLDAQTKYNVMPYVTSNCIYMSDRYFTVKDVFGSSELDELRYYYTKEVVSFDWKGNSFQKYILEHPIRSMFVNADDSVLYGIGVNEERDIIWAYSLQ
jgi:hypothetical protein